MVIANLLLFVGTLLICELKHRNILKTEVPFKTKDEIYESMSSSEF